MVDASSVLGSKGGNNAESRPGAVASPERIWVVAERADADALSGYRRFCETASFAPAQSPAWVECWTRAGDGDVIIMNIERGRGRIVALPLEIVTEGPFRLARFLGGRHANGNFAPASHDAASLLDKDALRTAFQELSTIRPDIDLVLLERQASRIGAAVNPLAALPAQQSPNPSLAVDLDGGFDALLDRASGKRKRKKHRSQTRKFEAAGGHERLRARTPDEIERMLDAFFAMKRARFEKMGIEDVFAPARVRAAFRNLFVAALDAPQPPFLLNGLQVAGKLRAVTGSSVHHDRITCEFGAIAEDDMAGASPGEFLFFENIREACENGASVYDFGVGDEPYKRLWCDMQETHFDCAIPLSLKGRLLAVRKTAGARVKRGVKNNRLVWSLVKRLRKSRAGTAAGDRTAG